MDVNVNIPQKMNGLFEPHRYKIYHGGRGCVKGDTKIATVNGPVAIRDFAAGPILTMGRHGVEIGYASAPVVYPPEMLYKVTLSSGETISTTAQHRFLTQAGWRTLRSFFSLPSFSDLKLLQPDVSSQNLQERHYEEFQSKFLGDARSFFEKAVGYLYHCSEYYRQGDEPPLQEEDIYLYGLHKLTDAPTYADYAYEGQGVGHPSNRLRYNRSYLRISPSSQVALLSEEDKDCIDSENCIYGISSGLFSELSQVLQQSHGNIAPYEQVQALARQLLAFYNPSSSVQSLQILADILQSYVHDGSYDPLPPFNTVEIVSVEEEGEQVFYDIFVPITHNYIAAGLIHHNSSKSWSFARVLLVKALQKKMRIGCFREVQKSIRDSVHRLLGDQIQALGLGSYFEVTRDEIRCPITGSVFLFAGLSNNTVESIKSFEGIDIAWVEEAQTVSERSWEILVPTIRNPDSEIWISMNPELETDPTYKRYVLNAKQLGDYICEQVNFYDNPYFPEVLRIEMETLKAADQDAYNHVWLGHCKKHGNAVVFQGKYTSYDFTPDEELWSPLYGVDFGFSQDATTFIKSWVFERTLYIEHEVYAHQLEIDMIPAMFDLIPGGRTHISRADCSRPETISYMKRNGYPRMIPCKKWPGSIEDGVDYMRSFDTIVIHPRCINILDEFRLYSYKADRLTGDILPEILDKFNHGMDAVRYSLEPLILGYKKRIEARKAPILIDSLGRPILPGRSPSVTYLNLTNPDRWFH